MCSRFVSEGSVTAEHGSRPRFFYNTTFDATALRERSPQDDLGPPLQDAERGQYLSFIDSGVLSHARGQGRCGSCWAYAITGAVQYATALGYRKLGGWFNNSFMSPQLLLSCVEEPGVACGCFGGDLSKAMQFVSKQGIVTFRQFPYENDSSVLTQEGQVHYICRPNEQSREAYLGTCAPCAKDEVDFEQVVPLAKGVAGTTTKFVTLSSCMPCGSIGPPFYFPVDPMRCYRAADGVEANVEAVKRLLVNRGPLCATIRVDAETFKKVGVPAVLPDVLQAPIYAPSSTPSSGALHSVLVLGYYDPWALTKKPEDRRRAFFVCRNSWGPEWGFKLSLRRLQLTPEGLLRVSQDYLGGFFCCSMYESFEQIGLVQTCLSIAKVQVKTLGDAAPRDLRLTDPFVVRFDPTFLAALEAQRQGRLTMLSGSSPQTGGAGQSDVGSGPRRSTWLLVALLLFISLGLLVALA